MGKMRKCPKHRKDRGKDRGRWKDGSVGKGTCHQVSLSEPSLHNPRGKRRKLTSQSYPLASTCKPRHILTNTACRHTIIQCCFIFWSTEDWTHSFIYVKQVFYLWATSLVYVFLILSLSLVNDCMCVCVSCVYHTRECMIKKTIQTHWYILEGQIKRNLMLIISEDCE